jgi:uncharacterized membrane protein YdbT with pleckstrin-like domain
MTYIQQTLTKDETLLAEGKISKWSLFHIYCAAVIFGVSIICLPISAALLLYAYLKIRSTEMGITSKRVILKSGVIMRDTAEIRLSKVESVSVKQGFLGRMFGYGDVVISGSGGNDAVMKGVKDPLSFRGKVQDACEPVVSVSINGLSNSAKAEYSEQFEAFIKNMKAEPNQGFIIEDGKQGGAA